MSFAEAVSRVLGAWPGYQWALQANLGGAHTAHKAVWLQSVVGEYFRDNADLDEAEVADWLAAVVWHEFDLALEDGSLAVVSYQLCRCYRLASESDWEGVDRLLGALPAAPALPTAAPSQPDDDVEEECDDDEPSTSAPGGGEPSIPEEPSEQPMDESSPVDDEWTVVKRHSKKR